MRALTCVMQEDPVKALVRLASKFETGEKSVPLSNIREMITNAFAVVIADRHNRQWGVVTLEERELLRHVVGVSRKSPLLSFAAQEYPCVCTFSEGNFTVATVAMVSIRSPQPPSMPPRELSRTCSPRTLPAILPSSPIEPCDISWSGSPNPALRKTREGSWRGFSPAPPSLEKPRERLVSENTLLHESLSFSKKVNKGQTDTIYRIRAHRNELQKQLNAKKADCKKNHQCPYFTDGPCHKHASGGCKLRHDARPPPPYNGKSKKTWLSELEHSLA